VELLFVDYGNMEVVPATNLRYLTPALAAHPAQCVQCSMYGIEPAGGDRDWSKEACLAFARLVEDQKLTVTPRTVYGGSRSLVCLFLCDSY